MKTKLIAGLVVLALVATAVGVISARNNFGVQSPMIAHQLSQGPCGMSQLTDEEKQEIQQQMQEFRQKLSEQYGITLTKEQREAIRQAIQERRHEMCQQMQEFRQELFEQYDFPLTDEERQEIREQLQEKREETQQEMQELFEQYGIDLTEEQRQEMQQEMQAFRQQICEQYGITCPGGPYVTGEGSNAPGGRLGPRMHGFRGRPGFGGFAPTQDLVE